MKKDILATIIFLTTGLLFYVVQTEGKADQLLSSGVGCDAAETAVITKVKTEAPSVLKDLKTRDS